MQVFGSAAHPRHEAVPIRRDVPLERELIDLLEHARHLGEHVPDPGGRFLGEVLERHPGQVATYRKDQLDVSSGGLECDVAPTSALDQFRLGETGDRVQSRAQLRDDLL